MARLKEKVALVTGGGSGGIGEAIAIALAEEGANVVVNDIVKELADATVEKIVKRGGIAAPNYNTVAEKEGAESIAETAIKNFGRVDILVNCAANMRFLPTLDTKDEDWDSIIKVHLYGHFNCIKAVLPQMIKQKGGRIINFSSRAAFGTIGNIAYTAAKAGILGMTFFLASEFKEHGITVNAIIPSADTKLFPGKRPKPVKATMPEPFSIEPEYVAPIVVYLSTDEAKDVTGRFIYASGGDLCFFAQPLELQANAPLFVRKMGKWSIEELEMMVPSLLGI